MAITIEQGRSYLESIGVRLPDFLLTLQLGRLDKLDACMIGAGYDEATQDLIRLYLLGLIGMTSGGEYITSQSAPNGASRSYGRETLADRYKAGLAALKLLDTSGCTAELIPAAPGAKAALFVANGGCWS